MFDETQVKLERWKNDKKVLWRRCEGIKFQKEEHI